MTVKQMKILPVFVAVTDENTFHVNRRRIHSIASANIQKRRYIVTYFFCNVSLYILTLFKYLAQKYDLLFLFLSPLEEGRKKVLSSEQG
jgi:hypothetical protein